MCCVHVVAELSQKKTLRNSSSGLNNYVNMRIRFAMHLSVYILL